jgi:hypothetical protein
MALYKEIIILFLAFNIFFSVDKKVSGAAQLVRRARGTARRLQVIDLS